MSTRPDGLAHFKRERLGPYRIEGEIARGGMGAVLRARHSETGAVVALKILLAASAATPKQRKRFAREALALAKLDHPATARVLDSGEEDRILWMAMELIDGDTLAPALKTLELRELVQTIARVARGLEQVHAAGIVHRDLKPKNILIRPDGSPVVTDFGVAHDLAQTSSLTKAGDLVGTPSYMAPEQATGGDPTPATDVHSLGVILYEGLTGVRPFAAATVVELLRVLIHREPKSIRSLAPDVPRPLEATVLKALSKKPEERHAHAGLLAEELEAFLEGRLEPAATGSNLPLVALGALAALVLGLVIAIAIGPPPPPPPETATPAKRAPVTPSPDAPAIGPRTLVLQPGPLEGKDTYLRSDGLYHNDNYGNDTVMKVGDRNDQPGDHRALIQFDLTRLPEGAKVLRAKLGLYLAGSYYSDTSLRVQAFRLLESGVRTPWVEGTSMRDRFLDGVCWAGEKNSKDFRTNSGRPFLSQPSADQGTDYDLGPGVVGEMVCPAGESSRWFEMDVTPAVLVWASGEAENHGLRLAHVSEGKPFTDGVKAFTTSDHADPGLRPRLTIEYEGAPPAPAHDMAPLEQLAVEEADLLLERLLADYPGSLSRDDAFLLAQRAVETAPFYGRALFERGRVLSDLRDPGSALVSLRMAERVSRHHRVEELFMTQGTILIGMKNWADLATTMTRGLGHLPGNQSLGLVRAEALRRDGRQEEALESLLPFVEGRGDEAWSAFHIYGNTLIAQGRHEEAAMWLERAVTGEANLRPTPRDYLPAVELARAASRLGRELLVEQALTAALEASKDDPDGVALVAKAIRDLGDVERSRQVLKDALQRYPAHPTLLETASTLER